MGIRVSDMFRQHLGELRYERTAKRIRGILDGQTLFDSRRAVLVWEPRRVLATYAVPVRDVTATLEPAAQPPADPGPASITDAPEITEGVSMLDPKTPFNVHSGPGVPVEARMPGSTRAAEGFRPDDPHLRDYVIFNLESLDTWLEEDEEAIGHPRDPYWRVDLRRSSLEVEVRLNGHTLASTNRPLLVFETMLPVRYYLPADAIRVPLTPSDTRSICPYKGRASYWNVELDGRTYPDLVWSYADPFPEARALEGLMCFYDEQVDLVLDGVARPRRRPR